MCYHARMLNLKEFIEERYDWAGKFAAERDEAEDYDARRAVNILLDELYRHYSEQELSDPPWIKIDFDDETSFPADDQLVTYFFSPFGNMFDGEYCGGTFFSKGGFCDCHDATHWKPRMGNENVNP